MKKLLSLVGIFALIITATSPIIACSGPATTDKTGLDPATTVKTGLDQVLTNKDLSTVYGGQKNKPNDQQIKDAIKNKNTDIDINAIDISEITKGSAIVTGNKTKYTGAAITVKFITTNFTELKGITGVVSSLIVFKNEVYVGTVTTFGAISTGNLYKSIDHGTTFIPIEGITDAVSSLIVFNDAIYVGTISNTATNGSLYRSTDGTNFDNITGKIIECGVINLTVFNKILYVGTIINLTNSGKLYSSTDGTTFALVADGIITDPVLTLNVLNNTVYVGTIINSTTSSNLYWSTNGIDFTPVPIIITGEIKSLTIFNNSIYIGTTTGNLYRSTDSAGTIFEDITTKANINESVLSLTVFNNKLYVGTATNGKLYRSADGINFDNITKANMTGAVNILTVINKKLYVGTIISVNTTSNANFTGNLYRSTDGTTFKDITKKENITGAIINLDIINGTIYVGTQTSSASNITGKLYKSDKY